MKILVRKRFGLLGRAIAIGGMTTFIVPFAPAIAAAQTSEEVAAARGFAAQGLDAYQAEKWQDAYDLFSRAESLFHAPPHVLYMARSAAKLGRLVDALELYNKVVREQLPPKAPAVFKSAQAEATQEMPALEPRIAHVTVQLEGASADQAAVQMNGKPVSAALIGAQRPMDPGQYEFSVTSETLVAEPVKLTLAEGATETVVLKLQPKPVEGGAAVAVTPQDTGTEKSNIPAYAALGLGAVGVVVGTVFLIDHNSKQGDADDLFEAGNCGQDNACSAATQSEIKDKSDKAATSGTLSWIGYGVGVAGIGAGVALLLLNRDSSSSEKTASEPHVQPLIGYRSIGLTGSF